MQVCCFTLSGLTAHFTNPEMNRLYDFTYGHIHKVALFGLFGSILGLKGYDYPLTPNGYPEFYEVLKDLQISVCPKSANGRFHRKMQTFNNATGFANFDKDKRPGTLCVTEEWLENPCWEIMFVVDSVIAQRLMYELLDGRCIYQPYLGKSEHPARIDSVYVQDAEMMNNTSSCFSSLVPVSVISKMDGYGGMYCYQEDLPIALVAHSGFYEIKPFRFTDMEMSVLEYSCLADGRNVVFW